MWPLGHAFKTTGLVPKQTDLNWFQTSAAAIPDTHGAVDRTGDHQA